MPAFFCGGFLFLVGGMTLESSHIDSHHSPKDIVDSHLYSILCQSAKVSNTKNKLKLRNLVPKPRHIETYTTNKTRVSLITELLIGDLSYEYSVPVKYSALVPNTSSYAVIIWLETMEQHNELILKRPKVARKHRRKKTRKKVDFDSNSTDMSEKKEAKVQTKVEAKNDQAVEKSLKEKNIATEAASVSVEIESITVLSPPPSAVSPSDSPSLITSTSTPPGTPSNTANTNDTIQEDFYTSLPLYLKWDITNYLDFKSAISLEFISTKLPQLPRSYYMKRSPPNMSATSLSENNTNTPYKLYVLGTSDVQCNYGITTKLCSDYMVITSLDRIRRTEDNEEKSDVGKEFHHQLKCIDVDGKIYNVDIYDNHTTFGYGRYYPTNFTSTTMPRLPIVIPNPVQEVYMYENVHCFILCFALNSTRSINKLGSYWIPHMIHNTKRKYRGSTPPFILVGIRTTKKRCISEKEGRGLALKLGSYGGSYFEYNYLSAHIKSNQKVLREIFEMSCRAASGEVMLTVKRDKLAKGCCVIN
jgi:hypothetical protein